ncbi:MAG TPA: hemerythrin domain-containing protein [Vicinamibacterales bacterium]|nr:hemerythrin domain-containing protein [Vicinamibacterales bacterium]
MPSLVSQIPPSLQAEHAELSADLGRLADEPGQVGAAAREVLALLGPHQAREEQFVFPPLGVLLPLCDGRITPDMGPVLALARQLKSLMPRMLEEHIAIVGALQTLADTAREVGRPDAALLAHQIIAHAQFEEEVLYPAAIVIGEYLATRLER